MQRKFITSLSFLIFANLLVKPLWLFGIDRTVQNMVGPEDYGSFFAMFNFAFLFHILLDFGINNFNNRALSRDPRRIYDYFPRLFQLKIILAVFYLFMIFMVSHLLNYNGYLRHLLLFVALSQILLSFVFYFRSNLEALQFFKAGSFLSVFDKLMMILMCSLVIWFKVFGKNMDIFLFVYIQTAAMAITAVIGLFMNLRHTGLSFALPEPAFAVKIFRMAYPFALLGILMSVYSRIDAVMIERLLPDSGSEEAGIYAASYRILDSVNMIPFMFATILLPVYSKIIKLKGELIKITQLASGMSLAIAVVVSVCSILFREELIDLLYSNADEYWSSVFGIVIASFLPISIMYIFGSLLTANGNLRTLNIIAGTGMVMNILLNVILIKGYGALGAAWATLATEWVVAIWHLVAARKYLGIPFPSLTIIRIAILVTFIIIGSNLLMITGLHWIAVYLLLMIFMIGVAASLKIFHPGEIYRAYRSEVTDEE